MGEGCKIAPPDADDMVKGDVQFRVEGSVPEVRVRGEWMDSGHQGVHHLMDDRSDGASSVVMSIQERTRNKWPPPLLGPCSRRPLRTD